MENPFHAGEQAAQLRAGVGDVSKWAGGFIRDHLPEQHRNFYGQLPFLVISGDDGQGRTWITLIDGAAGFIQSPDPHSLTLDSSIDSQDPLSGSFAKGTEVGAIGIELASRRRNRFSGVLKSSGAGYRIDIRQTFGNCPQYIHERSWHRVQDNDPGRAVISKALSPEQTAMIANAGTMFIGSGTLSETDNPSRGFDASHRGGAKGFVQIRDAKHLRIPDYLGNNFFNTIGNLIADPRVGLVFVDFETGGLLHLTGRATIDWQPDTEHDSAALRMIDVEIEAVIERPNALSLRWSPVQAPKQTLKVIRRHQEARHIVSFHLAAVDGKPLLPFRAGQHLPVELDIPGQAGPVNRSYSLSGSPARANEYRLTIKRQNQGLVSGFFHDAVEEGSTISASFPSGDFVIPSITSPLVLVSAGVGVTPMMAMLHHIVADTDRQPLWFVHGARNSNELALGDEIASLIDQHEQATRKLYFSNPQDADRLGIEFDKLGRINARDLLELNAGTDAHYLLCGPAQFLSDIRTGLEAGGVAPDHIHFEVFGPAG